MPTIKIALLQENHLSEAAALAAARYAALLKAVPNLPDQYGRPQVLLPMLREILGRAPGAAAFLDGKMVGFVLGFLIPFGGERTFYSPEWANGASSRRVFEELYVWIAPRWTANGCFSHIIDLLAHDQEALSASHWLGFGHCAADAVRDLTSLEGASPLGTEIRRAEPHDLKIVVELEGALWRYLAAAPTFIPLTKRPQLDAHRRWLADPAFATWLAFDGKRPFAYLRFGPASAQAAQIIRDPGTTSITGAFTLPKARGQGVGTALLNRGLAWARDQGYARCAVDFEPMNTLGARFWTRHFQLVSLASLRRIDSRVAWAATDRDTEDMW